MVVVVVVALPGHTCGAAARVCRKEAARRGVAGEGGIMAGVWLAGCLTIPRQHHGGAATPRHTTTNRNKHFDARIIDNWNGLAP